MSCAISRVSLSREKEQHWALRVVYNSVKTIEVCKQKMCTFVCSETTTEAYHQRVRVDSLKQRHHTRWVTLITKPLLGELITNIFNQFLLQSHTSFPYLFVRNVINSVPNVLVTLVRHKVLIVISVIQFTPFGCTPCREVHAVCNVTYMVFFSKIALP